MATKKANSKVARNGRARVEDDKSVDADNMIDSSSPRKMPWFGWLGLAIMVLNEIALWAGIHPSAVAFTPIMWTGYILMIDGWIWARGAKSGERSYFRDDPLHVPMLALFSILIWVMFEGFNFSVEAWHYRNIPASSFVRDFLYAWSFATILPAMLRTRSLFATFKMFDKSHPWKFIHFTPFWLSVSFIAGIALTFLPIMFTHYYANLLVGAVWIGLIFLIEPINYFIRPSKSVFRDIESPNYGGNGKIRFFWQAFWAGLLCGFLWETWNIQTSHFNGLYWDYFINKIFWKAGFELHWGKMPILGFLGYPPFIWECYALWELIKWAMHADELWEAATVQLRSLTGNRLAGRRRRASKQVSV
jgi:hypothetical protein